MAEAAAEDVVAAGGVGTGGTDADNGGAVATDKGAEDGDADEGAAVVVIVGGVGTYRASGLENAESRVEGDGELT